MLLRDSDMDLSWFLPLILPHCLQWMKFDGADFESFSISSHDSSPMSVLTHPMTVVMLLSHYGVLCVLRPMKMTQRSWQFLGTSSSAFCFLILRINIIQIHKQLYFNSVLKEQSSFTYPHVVQTCMVFFFPWNTEGQSQWIESFKDPGQNNDFFTNQILLLLLWTFCTWNDNFWFNDLGWTVSLTCFFCRAYVRNL